MIRMSRLLIFASSIARHYAETTQRAALPHNGLIVIFALALTLRVLAAILFSGAIDTEGAEYARIAENIRLGNGYSGIATEGTQLFFPPLFPFLIAGLSVFTTDTEFAGRAANIFFGALLVLPVWGIATRLYGKNMGLWASALVAVHPYLIYFSITVFCETIYITILLAAVFATMIATDQPTYSRLTLAGGFYGLAYLVRPEAVAFVLVGATCFFLGRLLKRDVVETITRNAMRAGVIIASGALIAAPYVLWLSLHTGQFRLQAKTPLNIATELRMLGGATAYAASFAVSQDLIAKGTYNRPNIEVIHAERFNIGDYTSVIAKKIKHVLKYGMAVISSGLGFGSPALFVLATAGLFGHPWRPRMAIDQMHLIILLAISSWAPLFIYYLSPRFFLLFPVVFCIWATVALQYFVKWARLTSAAFGFAGGRQNGVGHLAIAIAAASVLAPATFAVADDLLTMRGSRPIKALGVSLSASPSPLKIADVSTPLAFHARADFVWLPYSDEKTARKYLSSKAVTHVVLQSDRLDETPYLRKWFEDAVPDAQLVAEVRPTYGGSELVKVYRLELSPVEDEKL